jgi:hypothetical protein
MEKINTYIIVLLLLLNVNNIYGQQDNVNLDLFGSFGLFSSAESLELTPAINDPDFNSKVDYLFIGAGTHETSEKSRHVLLHEEFVSRNIKHDYYIGSNGAHTFNTWRHLLYYEFLPNLWRNDE